MKTYMLLAKYSPEGAKGATDEGLCSRRAVAEKILNAVGGRLIAYYACADGDWDFMNITEWPDSTTAADIARMARTVTMSGAYSQQRIMTLATPEEYDEGSEAGRAAEQTYRAPGET